MVYNSGARSWIHRLQDLLKKCQLTPFNHEDITLAVRLLSELKIHGRTLKYKFAQMDPQIFSNKIRFVDTFMHCYENRSSLRGWLNLFKEQNFTPYALLDRYAELDMLPCSLYEFPKLSLLEPLIDADQFQHNFEIYFYYSKFETRENTCLHEGRALSRVLYTCKPPNFWFDYPETNQISWRFRYMLWHLFLNTLNNFDTKQVIVKTLLHHLPKDAISRLYRIGALLPTEQWSIEYAAVMQQPIEEKFLSIRPSVLPEYTALPVSLSQFVHLLSDRIQPDLLRHNLLDLINI